MKIVFLVYIFLCNKILITEEIVEDVNVTEDSDEVKGVGGSWDKEISDSPCGNVSTTCLPCFPEFQNPSLNASAIDALNCMGCRGVLELILQMKGYGTVVITDYVAAYCDEFVIFSSVCKETIIPKIQSLVNDLTEEMAKDSICTERLHLCKSDVHGHPMLMAPQSRQSIVDDDQVLHINKIVHQPEWNQKKLRKCLGVGLPLREQHDQTLQCLAKMGLLANRRKCPDVKCQKFMTLVYDLKENPQNGFVWKCIGCQGNMTHDYGFGENFQSSIEKNTFFENSKLPLEQIVHLIYYWSEHPTATLKTIKRETEIDSKETIYNLYSYLGDMVQDYCFMADSNQKFSGDVEIDESIYHKTKYNHSGAQSQNSGSIIGLIERHSNNIRLFKVDKSDAATLITIIADNIEDGSRIYSEDWAAYGQINEVKQAYTEAVVNQNIRFMNPMNADCKSPSLESTFCFMKREMRNLCATSDGLFDTYFFNYMYRRHIRNRKVFQHTLNEIRRFWNPLDEKKNNEAKKLHVGE